MNQIVIPQNMPDFDDVPYRGYYQQFFAANIGKRVKIDFLTGSCGTTSQSGVVYATGAQYVVLYRPQDDTYITGEIFGIKFVTIFPD